MNLWHHVLQSLLPDWTSTNTVGNLLYIQDMHKLRAIACHLLSVVVDQVYQWSTPGSACWFETNICRNFTEPAGSQQLDHVEAHALLCGLSPHCCAGIVHSNVIEIHLITYWVISVFKSKVCSTGHNSKSLIVFFLSINWCSLTWF